MKIHPFFIMTAPVMILVSCAQAGANGRQAEQEPAVQTQQTSDAPVADSAAGRTLFLHNCAHCHGADASGDEGPDLHGIGWTEQQIANRIRHGKAGQMTAFEGKLKPADIDLLVTYVQGLK
jgi:mono/diheme cytochrome c family protein